MGGLEYPDPQRGMIVIDTAQDVRYLARLEELPRQIWFSKNAMRNFLPQRGKFLLPDEVDVFLEENRAVGKMEVRPKCDFTSGHFNVLPGVLQIEFAQQVALVLFGSKTSRAQSYGERNF